jgi:hypothetical protein
MEGPTQKGAVLKTRKAAYLQVLRAAGSTPHLRRLPDWTVLQELVGASHLDPSHQGALMLDGGIVAHHVPGAPWAALIFVKQYGILILS